MTGDIVLTLYDLALAPARGPAGLGSPALALSDVMPAPTVGPGRVTPQSLVLVPFLKGDPGPPGPPGATPTPQEIVSAFQGTGLMVDVLNLDGTLAYTALAAAVGD